MKAQRPNPRPLDHTDWQLVRRLQENARLSYHELGRQIGLSATAVAERVRRMEQSGVITGYHAQVDPTQVGLPIVAFIQTTCIRNRCLYTNALHSEFPEVIEYHRVTGRNCGVFKVCVPSVRHLEALIPPKRLSYTRVEIQVFIDRQLLYSDALRVGTVVGRRRRVGEFEIPHPDSRVAHGSRGK